MPVASALRYTSWRPEDATTNVPSEPGAGPDVIGICSSPATLTSTRVGVPAGGRLMPTRVPVDVKPTGCTRGSINRGGVGVAPMPVIHAPWAPGADRRKASCAPSGEIAGSLDAPDTPGMG